METKKRKLIPTCSLCQNYDSNRGICKITNEEREAYSSLFARDCTRKGNFIRDLNVIPDIYNYYDVDEKKPLGWKHDMSRLPQDSTGAPLFVLTKRGVERAIPAYSGVTLKGDIFLGVNRITTYQGQREAIYELGVALASQEAELSNVELIVLPEEKEAVGQERYIRQYQFQKQRTQKYRNQWMSDRPVEVWD